MASSDDEKPFLGCFKFISEWCHALTVNDLKCAVLTVLYALRLLTTIAVACCCLDKESKAWSAPRFDSTACRNSDKLSSPDRSLSRTCAGRIWRNRYKISEKQHVYSINQYSIRIVWHFMYIRGLKQPVPNIKDWWRWLPILIVACQAR